MKFFRSSRFRLIAPVIGGFLPLILACGLNRQPGLIETKIPVEQAPEIPADYVYYEIKGATANELRAQMDQLGPVDRLGHCHDMYTQWEINWAYPYSQNEEGCTTGPIEMSTTVTFTFPSWAPPPGASAELVDQWNRYLDLGQVHEDGHKEIALEASREILHALQAVPAHASCNLLEQTVDQKGQELLEQFRQKEIEYDRTTDHGATQGVRFP